MAIRQHETLSGYLCLKATPLPQYKCPGQGGWDGDTHRGLLVPTASGASCPPPRASAPEPSRPPGYNRPASSQRDLCRARQEAHVCLLPGAGAPESAPCLPCCCLFSRPRPGKEPLPVYCTFRCLPFKCPHVTTCYRPRRHWRPWSISQLTQCTAAAILKIKIKFFL